jgi:peptidoglycan hydrolase-like protein with peptidoglycan-binding domain
MSGVSAHLGRRRVIVGAAVMAVALAAVLAVLADPFGGSAASGSSGIDNGFPTSTTRVQRSSLSSQTQVSATLGYADPSTIVAPAGTAPSSIQQSQQALATAQAQLATARATLTADSGALAQDRAAFAAARAKEAVDCSGANAAETAPSNSGGGGGGNSGGGGGGGGGSTPCASDAQAVTSDEQAVGQAAAKVTGDQTQVSSGEKSAAMAQSGLAAAQASGSIYSQGATYTTLPAVGQIVDRGQGLYSISGDPVVLLYGSVAPWRAFMPGMSPGRDVAELNANLRALGDGGGLGGDAFTSATEAAVRAFQSRHGLPATGRLLLGSVVFEPRPVRVTSVTPTLGATVQAGPVLGITSTRREVTIALDAGQQTNVKVGDPVTITLPDNSTTPGRVSFVGTVATTPSSDNNGSSGGSGGGGGGGGSTTPTIEVDVAPTDPAATGRLDQAPVDVSITTGSVNDALVVPVNALLALSSGGYALEEVDADGVHRLVAVQLGLFDDADGLVQVTGRRVAAGQRVVVPAT